MNLPMPSPRYSLGIDLGTSNCALARVDLSGENEESELMLLDHADSADTRSARRVLPSCLYLPPEPDADWVPGQWAKHMSFEQPDRVVHSAKSWLCHPAVDRQARLLPWQSETVPPDRRLSPVEASARLLRHIRDDWERKTGLPLNQQQVALTVPASFDAAAQQLTLEAAIQAGFPDATLLMEEPQAAFYRWLEEHGPHSPLFAGDRRSTVLILDIGGGTSDFSLFDLTPGAPPDIRRTAVSEHLLLGGDNLDRFLAIRFRKTLEEQGPALTARQWSRLLAESRRVKESLFTPGPEAPEQLVLAGSGSGLFAETRKISLDPEVLRRDLVGAFFPACGKNDQPVRNRSGLRELGLPYAADPAVTRHLAAFLAGRPPVDFILCNGGTLASPLLRERLRALVADWNDGPEPEPLVNPEADVAVARGAAVYGARLFRETGLIEAGAARSVYLEIVDRKSRRAHPMCVLPRGSPPDAVHRIEDHPLRLTVDTPVRFQAFSSPRRPEDRPGDLLPADTPDLHPLPPMQTQIEIPAKGPKPANNLVEVAVEAGCNAAGLLKVFLVSRDKRWRGSGEWELSFNLRQTDQPRVEPGPKAPAASPRVEAARGAVLDAFGKKAGTDPRSARRIFSQLESVLRDKRKDWSLETCRDLWPAVSEGLTRRNRSKDHEAAWLNLAGFVLRPGFGFELDPVRINELWRLRELGLGFPKEARSRTQCWILWRRVAGGLDTERQKRVVEKWMGPLNAGGEAPVELIRLSGALERADPDTKRLWIRRHLKRLPRASAAESAALAWALGGLLGRLPFGGGPEDVLPPDDVVGAFDQLKNVPGLDWEQPELLRAFVAAARLTGESQLDVPEPGRREIADKLRKAGLSDEDLRPLREVVREEEAERARRFGESLPPGLTLGG